MEGGGICYELPISLLVYLILSYLSHLISFISSYLTHFSYLSTLDLWLGHHMFH